MSAPRTNTRCDYCGQTDDHPKVHIGEVTKHNDCLSADEKAMVVAASPVAADIIAACEGGLKGDDLLAQIVSLHVDVPTDPPAQTEN